MSRKTTRASQLPPVVAVFHSVMTTLTFLILSESVRYYRVKILHKKSCRNVLYSCYLNFSFGKPVVSQTLPERFLQELKVNSDDLIYYKLSNKELKCPQMS